MADLTEKNTIFYPRNNPYGKASLIESFPLIVVNQGKELLMVYDFSTEVTEDYVVLGKFKKDKIPKADDATYFYWIYHLNHLLQSYQQQNEKNIDYGEFFVNSEELLLSPLKDDLLFTQEGYDFVTGKFLFTDGYVQRTVELEHYAVGGKMKFGEEYQLVNQENTLFPGQAFQEYNMFDENYFMNIMDLQMIEGNPSCIYALKNKDRIESYLGRNYPDWLEEHYTHQSSDDPVEMIQFSLQLFDVSTDFQLNRLETRGRKGR